MSVYFLSCSFRRLQSFRKLWLNNFRDFSVVLFSIKWVSDCISDQMFQNIMSVLSGSYPFKAITHCGKTSSLIYGHAFLKIPQWFIEESFDKVNGLVFSISKQLNSRMPVSTHVHWANNILLSNRLQLSTFYDDRLVAI